MTITVEEARQAAVRLLRPYGVQDRLRIEDYAMKFATLHNVKWLNAAIDGVLQAHVSSWPPTIGQVIEAYKMERRRDTQPALPEAPMTPEQAEFNKRMARELVERFTPRGIE